MCLERIYQNTLMVVSELCSFPFSINTNFQNNNEHGLFLAWEKTAFKSTMRFTLNTGFFYFVNLRQT